MTAGIFRLASDQVVSGMLLSTFKYIVRPREKFAFHVFSHRVIYTSWYSPANIASCDMQRGTKRLREE